MSAFCLVKSCDESFFVILAGLDCFNDNVALFGNNKRNSLKVTLACNNGDIEFICRSDNCFCAKSAVMGKEGINGSVDALVALDVGSVAALVKRKTEIAAFNADAVFAVIEN